MKIKPYEETHMEGSFEISNAFMNCTKWVSQPEDIFSDTIILPNEDIGIQVAEDGRVWICINGISFLRFKPTNKYVAKGYKLEGGKESDTRNDT